MSRANTAQARTIRHPKLKIAVGDVVRWGSYRTIGVVQAIRVIESGRWVQSHEGNGAEVVLTISDGVGTAFIQPEGGVVTKLDGEEAEAALRQVRRKRL